MPIRSDRYKAPWWAWSGQASSLVPYFFRSPDLPKYQRERLTTFDGDWIDIDRLTKNNHRVVILAHGLEGSSKSQYILSAANLLHEQGFDVVAMNHRSCSGSINDRLTMYHSGFTDDIALIVEELSSSYTSMHLLGYSLGGNMVCRYLSDGKHTVPTNVHSGVAISVPTDLADSARALAHWSNKIYGVGFLRTLKDKAYIKAEQYPDQIDIDKIDAINTLIGFDDHFTAPIHGFDDAWDYYHTCSSKPYLDKTQRPLLMINALDDPFLGAECFPSRISRQSSMFHFLATKRGGHVGYMQSGSRWTYSEMEALQFFEEQARHQK